MLPSHGSPPRSTDDLRRRNRRLILGTLIVLVIIVYGIIIRQRLEETRDAEPFPPEKWTIVEPAEEG